MTFESSVAVAPPAGVSPRPICPLCRESDVRAREDIPVATLRSLYESLLGPSIREEFAGVPTYLTLYECQRCRLRYFVPALVGTARLYALLQAFPWYYEESKPEFATATEFIPAGARVLEIGCGSGHFRRHVAECSYVGLEPSAAARSQALANGIDVRSDSIEKHATGFAAGYDAVVAFQVLEHTATPRSFLESAVTCVAPGGVLAISVPSFDAYLGRARNCTLNLPPHHQSLWPDDTIKAIGSAVGVTLVKLVHEALRAIHVTEYRRLQIEQLLDRIRGARARTVDLSRGAALWSRLADALAKVQPFPIPSHETPGHTVTAIFRK